MMRLIHIILLLTSFVSFCAHAQETVPTSGDSLRRRPLLTHEILAASADTLSVSDGESIALPWSPGRYPWRLHEGVNAEVGVSVSASFGKNRRKSAGFGEHLALAYAMPFGKDKRWLGAIGVYGARMDWGTWHQTEAGIAGILGYRAADWCNLYLYGSYNFVPGDSYCGRYPYYGCYGGYGGPWGSGWDAYPFDPYANFRGRIGAAAEFKIGRNASISVAVEHDFYDNQPGFFDVSHGVPGYNPAQPGGNGEGKRRIQAPDYGTRPGMPVNGRPESGRSFR